MTATAGRSAAPRHRGVPWWLPWGALVLVVGVLLGFGARARHPASLNERTEQVARTIKCPACTDESVATSDAPVSQAARKQIRDDLAAGRSPDEIRARFVATYGESILLTPKRSGIDSLVWILPVVVLVGGAGGLAFAFWRWRQLGLDRATDEDRAVVAAALAEEPAAHVPALDGSEAKR